MVSNYADHIPEPGTILIHLGEPSSVEGCGLSHVRDMVDQATSLLGRGYDHVIYSSSVTVYSDGEDKKLVPDCSVEKSGKIYSDGKIEVEKVVLDIGGTVARISNVYGPGMSDKNIFSDILKQLPFDGPLLIREATSVREYLWITDLVKCLILMMKKQTPGIFNVSSDELVSCRDVAQMILNQAGQHDREIMVQQPPRKSVLRLDICKTVETFNWEPQVSLVEGINILLNERNYG